ncbi:MAG: BamA/TamA family outer membrane protein, partial [Flavobacteriales bacterium]
PLTQITDLVCELNIQLQNNWQKNEKLQLNWRSIAPQTQQLKTSLQWPYIAGSPYGLNTGLTIYKRDTAFLEMRTNFGVCYQFAGGWQLSAQLDYWRSNALKDLPGSEVTSFRTTTYGLVLQRQKLDRIQNPTKGMLFQTSYLVGNRLTSEKVLTWRFTLAQRYFLSLAQRQVLCFTQQFDHIAAPILYRNELYRFGGLDRMRGFDEEAFFASTALLTGLEYRFLLDENSYALAFSDWAWSANQVQPAQKQQLYAFGMGLVLGTENGQFKLNYALGATIGEGLKLNAGKIHLGYISYF